MAANEAKDAEINSGNGDATSTHIEVKDLHSAAERGFFATDQYGRSLVAIDPAAETKLRRKIDLMIIPIVSLLYLFCFIDRANIGNAKIIGLEKDLGMTGAYDYNQLASIFYISYIVFEIPSNIACKWMGPGWFLPLLTLGFGVLSFAFAFVHNLPQGCGVRFLLGMFESGVMPGMSYFLSRWYRRSELTLRIAYFIVMAPLAGAFGGLLASGISSMSNIGTLTTWRMIFFVEGLITIGLSLIAFVILTDRPQTARWLTQEEKDLAIARIKSERVAQAAVIDTFDKRKLWLGFWNPSVIGTALVFMLNNITIGSLAFFLPTIISTIFPKTSGYTVVQQQLLTVPPYVFGAFWTILFPYLARIKDKRQVYFVMSAPPVMVGYIIFLATQNQVARYVATFVIASTAFSLGPLCNSQAAAQVVSDTSRSVSLAVNMLFGNVGGLVATWSFISWDGPDYHIGNGLNLGTSTAILLISSVVLVWMHRDNTHRDTKDVDHELAGLSRDEIENLEWKHPGWRWKP